MSNAYEGISRCYMLKSIQKLRKEVAEIAEMKRRKEKSKGVKMLLSYEDLDVFYKFCVNRVGYDLFKHMMLDIYPDSGEYVEDKWPGFRDDPIGFIIRRGEIKLFSMIIGRIEEIEYKG